MRCAQGEALSGRVALVTGATGSMGAAIAQRLADEGAAVVGVGRTSESGLGVAMQIVAGGGRAYAIPHMLRTGTGGAIVSVSSISASRVDRSMPAYAASKVNGPARRRSEERRVGTECLE